jgi:hypothetical protein
MERLAQSESQIFVLEQKIDSLINTRMSDEIVISNSDTIQAFLPFDPKKVIADSLKWVNQADSIQTLAKALVFRENVAYKRHLISFQNINNKSYATIQKLQNLVDSINSVSINLGRSRLFVPKKEDSTFATVRN